jgi:hypothetical protein
MSRWIWFSVCAVVGLVTLVCGWLAPVHLRAVDASVIERAGRRTPALIENGIELVNEKDLGSAQLVLRAAQAEELPGREKLALAMDKLARERPGWQVWGGGADSRLENIFNSPGTNSGPQPLTEFLVRAEHRTKALELLRASPDPAVQELLRCRLLAKTSIFPPSQSASGQAFDTAISIGGLLLEQGRLTQGLSQAIFALASEANNSGNSQRFELALLDLMSLGQRFNWDQLAVFAGRIEDTETLRRLANDVRQANEQLPALFSATQFSGKPADVARYLADFSRTGLKDLGASLRFGAGGINELLRRDQRLYSSDFRQRATKNGPLAAVFDVAADCAWRTPGLAMAVKWLMYLAGGFLIAAALHFARPAASVLEQPLQVRGFHLAREFLFALGFLLVALILTEPFLSQESQKVELPFRLRLPMAGGAVSAGTGAHPSIMKQVSQMSLLTLLLFFVLQGLIYTACIVKLAEIRRQKVPPRIKLKLLENEDHLFDAGLYLGFVGTIVSLILVSLGIIQFSLMAAYSSTSFGIIFVSFFKIFHLRPARRKLLLEAENFPEERVSGAAPSLATMS